MCSIEFQWQIPKQKKKTIDTITNIKKLAIKRNESDEKKTYIIDIGTGMNRNKNVMPQKIRLA